MSFFSDLFVTFSTIMLSRFIHILFYFIFKFIFRERRRKGDRKGEKHQCAVASWASPTGTWPTSQACALTGNQTGDPLVHRPALSPLSHTSQGDSSMLYHVSVPHSFLLLKLLHCAYIPHCVIHFSVVGYIHSAVLNNHIQLFS